MTNDNKPVWSKIGFRQEIEDLTRNGPTAAVHVGPAPYDRSSQIKCLALVDTGAAGTAISPRLVGKLGIKPTGSGVIQEAGREPITANFYLVTLSLPWMDIEVKVAGLPSLAEPHDVLVGRDVMANCRLTVDFTAGITHLHFKLPAQGD